MFEGGGGPPFTNQDPTLLAPFRSKPGPEHLMFVVFFYDQLQFWSCRSAPDLYINSLPGQHNSPSGAVTGVLLVPGDVQRPERIKSDSAQHLKTSPQTRPVPESSGGVRIRTNPYSFEGPRAVWSVWVIHSTEHVPRFITNHIILNHHNSCGGTCFTPNHHNTLHLKNRKNIPRPDGSGIQESNFLQGFRNSTCCL